jgi:hypothetical protein
MEISNRDLLIQRYNNPEYRVIAPLSTHQEFYNRVYLNLYVTTQYQIFNGKEDFTLLINAVRRDEQTDHKRYGESPELCYAGCGAQRDNLETGASGYTDKVRQADLDMAWDFLSHAIIQQSKSEVSSSFYTSIQDGSYALGDACRVHSLQQYFDKPANTYTKEQQMEKTVLSAYFDVNKCLFFSVPLIGYAEIDGIVHIIFKEDLLDTMDVYKDEEKDIIYLQEKTIKGLVMGYLQWYEEILLDWDTEGENIEQMNQIRLLIEETILSGDKFFNVSTPTKRTKIFEELGLVNFYQKNIPGFKKRLERTEILPGKIYQQYITNAVTAILIDSYAHNVSAHALSTLSWWYLRRSGRLKEEEALWEPLLNKLKEDKGMQEAVQNFEDALKKRRKTRIAEGIIEEDRTERKDEAIREEDGRAVIEYPGSLSREFAQLLRFLTEKGAFWSGVTRDANIGGKISTLYSILWYDFIRNPLYLGTIAKTEDIMHVRLRIIIYDPEPGAWREDITDKHIKTFKPENDFIFAEVDLKNPRTDLADKTQRSPHEEVLSAFVKKGDNFDVIRQKLKEIKLFFPGGVVGRHAFYTMIENEIRNVKHYSREKLRKLQQHGLTVAIGVQACSLHNSINKEIYRISVWLDTDTQLFDEEKKEHLLQQKWDILKGDIVAKDNFAALLGGTYQDKVCACFLFNSNFSQVQRGDRNLSRDKKTDSGRDRRYYSWVRPACSALEEATGIHTDYKMSYSNPQELDEVKLPENAPKEGYLKKVFYMWKGDNMLEWEDFKAGIVHKGEENSESWDNPSRFSIVHINPSSEEERTEVLTELRRNRGLVRIVEGDLQEEDKKKRFENGYIKWLGDFYKKEVYALRFSKDGETLFRLIYDGRNGKSAFYHDPQPEKSVPDNVEDYLKEAFRKPAITKECSLELAHGGDSENDRNIIHYRNHAILRNYFFKDQEDKQWLTKNKATMMELFEVFATKICIFDNRIHQRLRLGTDSEQRDDAMEKEEQNYRAFMRNKLKLMVHKESLPKDLSEENGVPFWLKPLNEEERYFIKDCHFLVMHLSLIESILQKGETTTRSTERDTIALFLEKYLMPFIGERDNFFFVVTTGRGRNQWWTSLDKREYNEKGYARFTLFRPIESFLAAVENATGIKDDVELKYRIVKILFGS